MLVVFPKKGSCVLSLFLGPAPGFWDVSVPPSEERQKPGYAGRQDCHMRLEGVMFPSVPCTLGPAGWHFIPSVLKQGSVCELPPCCFSCPSKTSHSLRQPCIWKTPSISLSLPIDPLATTQGEYLAGEKPLDDLYQLCSEQIFTSTER